MSLKCIFQKYTRKYSLGLILIGLSLVNTLGFAIVIKPVSGSPGLSLKWMTPNIGAGTYIGPLAADLRPDRPGLEIIVTGTTNPGVDLKNGTVAALDGTNGKVIWQIWPGNIVDHNPFEIADLNKDGIPEIVLANNQNTLVLHGNNGSVYWKNDAAPSFRNSPAICDINGDGYPEVFVSSGLGPWQGYDWITSLSYDGQILNQAYGWRPCWGGLTIGDTNFDGRFELFQGDRSETYNHGEPYEGGGMGIRCLDAYTLTPLWNDPTILCSSQDPILADVDKDGTLDVIVGWQSYGLAVLNAKDGSVLTTPNGKNRKNSDLRNLAPSFKVHSQPTVTDVDGDGNLEIITCQDTNPTVWDLYNWELDVTLPVACGDPPKVGDVNGDGKMDIIAVTGDRICVYDVYPNKTYKLVDQVTGLDRARDFTILQDVDNDEFNELVLTSLSGRVYCYDTPARAPTPRARSEVQFYSEYRCGAAEYVLPPQSRAHNPPTHSNPILVSSCGDNTTNEDLICSNQTTNDPDRDKVTNIYNWYVNDSSLTNLLLPFDTRLDTSARASLIDGFEKNFDNWNGNGITDWDRTTSQKHSGLYSAHAYGGARRVNDLISDNINASGAKSITVSFWYRDHGIDVDDYVYLQFWDGSTYNNIFGLGNTSPEDEWHHYSVWYRTLFKYRIPDFRVKFEATGIDSGEDLWIDDVSITLDAEGAHARDYSGNNNHGIVHGASWTDKGVVGGAYYFDGNDYISIRDDSTLDGDSAWSEITIEHWIYLASDQMGSKTIAKMSSSTEAKRSYQIGFQSSGTSNRIYGAVIIGSNIYRDAPYDTPLSKGLWYHVVLTYKSGVGIKLYVNGLKVAANSTSVTGKIQASPGKDLYIGCRYGSEGFFNGKIDEVRLYPRTLSAEQIYQRYLESRDGFSNNSTIVSQETSVGDVWKCEVTPNDGFEDGESKFSNTLTVLPPHTNSPPRINWFSPSDTTPEVNEGGSLKFTHTSSDTDGDSLTYSWLLDSVFQADTQNWTYSPSYKDAGIHNITLSVSDGEFSVSQQWDVIVLNVNRAPVIDSFYPPSNPTISEGESQEFNVTHHDPDGDTETIQWYLNGTPIVDTENFVFVADFNSAGVYNVTVVVSDGYAQSSHEWNLTILNVNRPPSINSFTPENTAPSVNEGDSLEFTHTSSDPDNDALSYSWLLDSVEKSNSQNWTYTPGFDEAGLHNVTLVVSDPLGLFDSQQWSVTVENVNRPPSIDSYHPLDDPTIMEGESQGFHITKSDADGDLLTVSWFLNGSQLPETSDSYLFTAESGSEGVYNVTVVVAEGLAQSSHEWILTVVVNQAPVIDSYYPSSDPIINEVQSQEFNITYHDPDGDQVTVRWYLNGMFTADTDSYTFVANYDSARVYNVTVVISDGLAQASREWTLTVLNVNRPPVIDSFTPYNTEPQVNEGATLDFTQVSSDPDGDPLTYLWLLDGAEQTNVQNWTYSPDFDAAGFHKVTLSVSDPSGLFVTHQWNVTVNNVNRPPTIDSFDPMTNPTIHEAEQQQFSVTYSDPDGDSVTVQWYLNGTPTVTTASYIFVADYESSGTYNVTVVVSDGSSQESHEWSLKVLNVNRAPSIDSFTPQDLTPEVNEGSSLEFTHTSSDPDGDPLTYSWLLDSVFQADTQNWTYSPGYDAAGIHNVTLAASDGEFVVSQQWSVTVINVNRAPTIDSYYPLTNPTLIEGESQEFNVTCHDPDRDTVIIQWYLNSTPTVATDSYTFVSSYDSAGVYNVTVVISDGYAQVSREWILIILDVNRSPTIDSYAPIDTNPQVNEGASLNFAHISSDPDGDPLTYSWLLDSVWQSDAQNWTYTPSFNDAGVHNVTLVVSDQNGLFDSHWWGITVINVNRVPTINLFYPPADPTIFEGESQQFSITYSDPDGEILTLQWYLNGTPTVTVDSYTFVADYTSADTYNVTVVVSDGMAQASHSWNLIVLDVNRPPTIDSFSPTDTTPKINVGASLSFTHTSSDPDGDTVSCSWFLDSVQKATSQNWTYSPGSEDAGTHNVTLVVSDGESFDSQQWNVTVAIYLFESGFETGDFNEWSGTYLSGSETATVVQTPPPHHGIYQAKFTTDGSAVGEYAYARKTFIAQSFAYARIYFKITGSLPAAGKSYEVMGFRNTNNGALAKCLIENSLPLRWRINYLKNGGFSNLISRTPTISLDTWYCIELYYKVDGTHGEIAFYINGNLIASDSNFDSNDRGNINALDVGERYSSGQTAHSIYVDCGAIDTAYVGIEGQTAMSTLNYVIAPTTSMKQKGTFVEGFILGSFSVGIIAFACYFILSLTKRSLCSHHLGISRLVKCLRQVSTIARLMPSSIKRPAD